MSWYDIIRDESPVILSLNAANNFFKFQVIGDYVVDQKLKHNSIYLVSRKALSNYFVDKFCPIFNPRSDGLSKKILESVIFGKDVSELFPEVFSGIQNLAKKTLGMHTPLTIPTTIPIAEQSLLEKIDLFLDNFSTQISNGESAFVLLADSLLKGEEHIENLAKQQLIISLEPLCAKALKAAFKSLVKIGIEKAYDKLWKKIFSVAGATIIYKVALRVFAGLGSLSDESGFKWTFELIHNTLPSPSNTLTILTTLHVAKMANIFWVTTRFKPKRSDLNKAEIKALLIKLTKEPIKRALEKKNAHKLFWGTFSEKRMDIFIGLLLSAIVELYWDDLHEIYFLNIPLVT